MKSRPVFCYWGINLVLLRLFAEAHEPVQAILILALVVHPIFGYAATTAASPDHHGIYRLDWGMGSSTHPELCSTRHNPYSGTYIGSNQQQVFSFTTPPVLFLQPRSIKTKEASINCLHGQRV